MWYFRSKYQKIRALIKASCKQLKTILVLGVGNFGLAFVSLKLGKFSLFDNFFSNLTNFQNLNNFLDFLKIFLSLLIPNLLTLLLPTPSHLGVNLSSNTVIFSIKMSGLAILLNP